LAELLRGSGLEPLPAAGTYFQLVDYGAISQEDDFKFADRLIREAKVATIPLSPFYATPPRMTLVRLCIAKRDETLREAAARLCAFAQKAAPVRGVPQAG
jgi:methionine aminotransferase